MSFIYLASPYTHPDEARQRARYREVVRACAALVTLGKTVYSPIAHFHPIAELHDLPRDFAFWQRINRDMLSRADALYVLRLPGWKNSKGVKAEIALAEELLLPIIHVEPEDLLREAQM